MRKDPLLAGDRLVHGMEEMRIACKLDLRQAFHNLVLAEESRDITSFQCAFVKFRYARVAMGLVNASHTLCEYLTQLLGTIQSVTIYYADSSRKLGQLCVKVQYLAT